MKRLKELTFPFIIALAAIAISGSAAVFSVTGLAKLFAGASLAVIIMAGSLELAKLVTVSLLYQYWSKLNMMLKTYLMIAAFVLMIITSLGIYGFLSSAYQTTANKAGIIDKEIIVYNMKKDRYIKDREGYISEKTKLDESISSLRSALGNNVIKYKDKDGNIMTSTSSANRKAYQEQLNNATDNRDKLSSKIEITTDSISKIEIQILGIESNSEITAELGPLKYLHNLTGKSMDGIVNWLLLIIIFVFDPLAVALIIASNFAFNQVNIKGNIISPPANIIKDKTVKEPDLTSYTVPLYEGDLKPIPEPLTAEIEEKVKFYQNLASKSQQEAETFRKVAETFRKGDKDDTITYM